jgi:hypothetical protein
MAHLKKSYLKRLTKYLKNYWRVSWWHKTVCIFSAIIILLFVVIYGVGQWYINSEASKPFTYGVSFVPDYAQSLGLNPQQTMQALLNIGVKQFRLTSYWSDIEPTKGVYNFSQLDWEFKKAEAAHAKIELTVGLRQPRWPECHPPAWVNTAEPAADWQPELEGFMTKVINRYKNSPALASYQLENEYFLKGFGECNNFSRSRLVSEDNLLKRLDPNHKIIIARSNNALGIPINQPKGDEYSISIYRRVWDGNVTHRYLDYPFTAHYYAFLAGIQKIFLHRDMVIGEMQAEAWPPEGQGITTTSLKEQNKSMNAKLLKQRFEFGKATGMRQVDLWGAEYWYYRLVILHDPSLWNVAKQEFKQ